MKTEDKRVCSVCGTLIAGDSEVCPVCILQGALKPQSDSISASDVSSELRFEHYRVLQNDDGTPIELGCGAMGVTYKAFDVLLQRSAALKIINARLIGDDSTRHRFLREARAAASVRHPNVATVFNMGKAGGDYFYAMEFVDGETLEKLIRRSGTLKTDLALEIVTQVAAGLAAIDKQHLVHRDIKSSNIMVSLEDGGLETVKIIDLGLAKGVAEDGTISAVGNFIGTPAYASPEQFGGIGTDIRSDLYSLGVTLWEMLTGKLPFEGSGPELMYQHQHTAPLIEKVKAVPAPVVTLLEVLLEKDPSQRFQDPMQLRKALTRVKEALDSGSCLTGSDLRKIANQPAEQASKRTRRKSATRWLVLSAGCATALLIGWWFLVNHGSPSLNRRSTDSTLGEKSIAVLPFENISPNKDDAYFADGVQDEILNNLAKIAQLKVISRTSVMQYRSDNKRDLRQIADALGVANVLEGTVRRQGNHVRVSTELVDARNDNTIWADSYDRDLTDIFAIQSEIAQKVASTLSAQLSPQERKDIKEKPTNNLEAYDLYLQAKQLLGPKSVVTLWGSEKGAYSKAINLLEEATQKDHEFALAYCMIAKAHDYLYSDRVDHTPGRRALGDAAVNEALRLRPDLAEVHLAAAIHLFYCYRDFERARVQIAIAAQTLPNNPDLVQLTAMIDQVQGRWEKATTGLEKATTLDPRDPELLNSLANNYWLLRRYRDYERISDRLVQLEPDEPLFKLNKAQAAFAEKADLKGVRAAFEALPPSMKDDAEFTLLRIYYTMCTRDFAAAEEIVTKSPNEEIRFAGAAVPRRIVTLWLELVQGNHPTMAEFGAAREQLHQKVEADPTDPFLMQALAIADLALGRKQESMQEARRALEMRPISEDAIVGPVIATHVAMIYAWENQPNLAFEQLSILIKIPGGLITYGDLKTNPGWDPLRKDPRFDKLLAELAPKE